MKYRRTKREGLQYSTKNRCLFAPTNQQQNSYLWDKEEQILILMHKSAWMVDMDGRHANTGSEFIALRNDCYLSHKTNSSSVRVGTVCWGLIWK